MQSTHLSLRCGQHLEIYSILHWVGFTSFPHCYGNWWSLTPPFHPYPDIKDVVTVFFLLHFPCPRGLLPLGGTLSCSARTFLPDTSVGAVTQPTQIINYLFWFFPKKKAGANTTVLYRHKCFYLRYQLWW